MIIGGRWVAAGGGFFAVAKREYLLSGVDESSVVLKMWSVTSHK